MKSLTMNQWNAAGFVVIKGQKSNVRNAKGMPLFDESQVKPFTRSRGFTDAEKTSLPRSMTRGFHNKHD